MRGLIGLRSSRRHERLAPFGDPIVDRQQELHRIDRRQGFAYRVLGVSGGRRADALARIIAAKFDAEFCIGRAPRDAAVLGQFVIKHAETFDDALERLMDRRQRLIRALAARVLRLEDVVQFALHSEAHGRRLSASRIAENLRGGPANRRLSRLRRCGPRVLQTHEKIVDLRLKADGRAASRVDPFEPLRQGADLSFKRFERAAIGRGISRLLHAVGERPDESRQLALALLDARAVFDPLRECGVHAVEALDDVVEPSVLFAKSRR